jgi:hypothetical protein
MLCSQPSPKSKLCLNRRVLSECPRPLSNDPTEELAAEEKFIRIALCTEGGKRSHLGFFGISSTISTPPVRCLYLIMDLATNCLTLSLILSASAGFACTRLAAFSSSAMYAIGSSPL